MKIGGGVQAAAAATYMKNSVLNFGKSAWSCHTQQEVE
jgi:hypothetical protein